MQIDRSSSNHLHVTLSHPFKVPMQMGNSTQGYDVRRFQPSCRPDFPSKYAAGTNTAKPRAGQTRALRALASLWFVLRQL